MGEVGGGPPSPPLLPHMTTIRVMGYTPPPSSENVGTLSYPPARDADGGLHGGPEVGEPGVVPHRHDALPPAVLHPQPHRHRGKRGSVSGIGCGTEGWGLGSPVVPPTVVCMRRGNAGGRSQCASRIDMVCCTEGLLRVFHQNEEAYDGPKGPRSLYQPRAPAIPMAKIKAKI